MFFIYLPVPWFVSSNKNMIPYKNSKPLKYFLPSKIHNPVELCSLKNLNGATCAMPSPSWFSCKDYARKADRDQL